MNKKSDYKVAFLFFIFCNYKAPNFQPKVKTND